MNRIAGLLSVAVLVSGCGGSDDRPDLEASPTTVDSTAVEPRSTVEETTTSSTSEGSGAPVLLSAGQLEAIGRRADELGAAIASWDERVTRCVGPSRAADDPGATCVRAAWEQLFGQMDFAQYYLLGILDRLPQGPCRERLATVVDAVHGFLAGATPTIAVWLDERQQPPNLFDLESVVDVARSAPARMHDAAVTTCGP